MVQQQGQQPRLTLYSSSGLLLDPYQIDLEHNDQDYLAPIKLSQYDSIAISELMVIVSLAKWCNNRVSNRDIPGIHHWLICRIRTKSTWNTTIKTIWHQSNYRSLLL
jgi:hypothetical protein